MIIINDKKMSEKDENCILIALVNYQRIIKDKENMSDILKRVKRIIKKIEPHYI
jgi:hypothetical protein